MDDALDLVAVVDGDGQDVVVADDGGVGVAEDLPQLRVFQEALDDVLHALLDVGQLLPNLRQFAAGHVEDVAAAVDAAGDAAGDVAEVLDGGEQLDEARALGGQAHAVSVDVAGAGEGVGGLQELLDGQLRPDGGAADGEAHVVQPAERRRHPLAERLGHLGDEGQFGADGAGVAERLDLAGQLLAERAGGVAGDQLADLVEFQEVERVTIHSQHPSVAVRTAGRRRGFAGRRPTLAL